MNHVQEWRTWQGRIVEGKFPLRQWLGGSAHSAVFLTDRPGPTPQKAAIKLAAASSDADRLLANWRAVAQLSHPNLLRIFESGRFQVNHTPFLYVVTECADEDLSQILPQRPLTPAEVAAMLPPVLDALSYLHGKGFAHGRVTPTNVLALGDQLKLSSDQIVPLAEKGSEHTRRDVYDAPETTAGIVTPAGDIWSLGVTLVAALTQNVPFTGEAGRGDPGLPTSIPDPFRGIVRECLHLDPKRRCSIAEIQAQLQTPGRPVPASLAPEYSPPPSTSRTYRFTWRALIPVAILLAFVFGARFYHSILPQKTLGGGEQSKTEAAPAPSQAQIPAVPPRVEANAQGKVLRQVLPDVPQSARDTITGTVRLSVRVEVDASGKVTAAELASPGPSKYFADLALKAAQSWEFSPPEVGGQPVASVWLLRFGFKQTSTQVSPQRLPR